MRRRLLALFLLLLGVASIQPAVAQVTPPPTAGGYLNPSQMGAGLGGSGGPPSSGGGGGSETPIVPVGSGGHSSGGGGGTPSPYKVTRTYDAGVGGSIAPTQGAGCQGPNGERGIRYIDTVIDIRTGEVVSATGGCEYPGSPGPSVPGVVVPPPPPPPTPDEIWASAPLPDPTFGLLPTSPGLTGLTTKLWDPNGGGSLSATVTLRGYTATATVQPVRWEWRMAGPGDTSSNHNPPPLVTATQPGSQQHPAATYMYETIGDYTLTMTLVWSGSYTYSGPGVPPQTASLGAVTRSSTLPYHVAEVRSVLEALPS